MNQNKGARRILAMALSIVMVLGMMPPITAMAAPPIGTSGEIIAFEALNEEMINQEVALGTSLEELDFPETLTATVRIAKAATPESICSSLKDSGEIPKAQSENEPLGMSGSDDEPKVATPSSVQESLGSDAKSTEQEEVPATSEMTIPVPVEWVAHPAYDGKTAGTYIFTAEVEDYVISASLSTITVTVQDEEIPIQTGGEISAFEALEDEITRQTVTMGTPISGLTLPETLAATVDGEAASVPVTWDAEPEYNPGHEDERPGEYIFTPQPGEGYTLADGLTPPSITVNTILKPMVFGNGPIDITMLSIPDIKTAIETELATENTVTVIGSNTGIASTLSLNIPNGKTVQWAATFEADSSFSGDLIELPDDGTFEVVSGGTVSATIGRAIYANGASSTVNVSGGVVTGAGGDSYYPVIYMDNTSNTRLNVTVSGDGKVEATANDGIAIQTPGSVEVKGSAEVSATTGRAINAYGASSTVTVSGGGKVKATANGGNAIRTLGNVEVKDSAEVSATTGRAIYAIGTSSTVTVSGGTVSATTGSTICTDGASSKVTVSGGTVEGAGSDLVTSVIYMSGTPADTTAVNVTVSGNSKVNATADGGIAIRTAGSVEVKDNAEVSATTERAIEVTGTNSTVTVSGGKVSATSGHAILSYGNVEVKGTGKVSATNGYAVTASGNVEIKDNAEVSATSGFTIYNDGASSTITVSGSGKVTADGGIAIHTYGSVEVKDSAEVSSTTGTAIKAIGASSTVTVSGGTVSATTGSAIDASGASAIVTVSGGTVSATATNGTAISANGTSSNITVSGSGKVQGTGDGSNAIWTAGNVEIKGNAEVSAVTNGYAICTVGASSAVTISGGTVSKSAGGIAINASGANATVTVSGGVVFALKHLFYDVIYLSQNPSGYGGATGTGVVITWDASANNRTYPVRSTQGITTSPADAAYWYTSGSESGISYKNGANEGFIRLADVTVNKITLTKDDFAYTDPATLNLTYNGSAQAIAGSVTLKPPHNTAFNSTTGGTRSMYFNGSPFHPQNAGTYAVTVEISGGTEYEPVIIPFGDYTIAPKPLMWNAANEVDNKPYDGTTTATVRSGFAPTLAGIISGDTVTVTAGTVAFASANAGSNIAITASGWGIGGADAGNYTAPIAQPVFSVGAITKASGLTHNIPGGTISIVESNTAANNLDLNDVIKLTPPSGCQTGAVSYALGTFADGGNNILAGAPTLSGDTLTYTGAGKNTGTATQVITVTTANYADITVTLHFEATEKTPVTVTVIPPANITYGQTLGNPSASAGGNGIDYTFTYSYSGTGGTTYGPTAAKPTLPGSYTVTATLDSATHQGDGLASFTIAKKQLAWDTNGEVNGKPYDGTTTATVATAPTLSGVINSDDVTVTTGSAAFSSSNAGTNVTVTANGWGIGGADAAYYNAPTVQPVFAAATISKITLTWNADGTVYNKPYDGNTTATVDTTPTLNGTIGSDTVDVKDGTVTFASTNVGNGIAVTATGWGIQPSANYNAPTVQPVFANADITKASATGVPQTLKVAKERNHIYTFDLTTLLPADVAPAQVSAYTVTGTSGATAIFVGTLPISDNILFVHIEATAQTAQAATITIDFTSGNYNISSAVVTVEVINKIPVGVFGVTVADKIYDGKPFAYRGSPIFIDVIEAGTINGLTPIAEYSSNGGSSWSTAAPKDVGSYKLRISAATNATYEVTPQEYNFTISKASITITADNKTATVGASEPTYTYTATGLVTGETLATTPTLTCNADMSTIGTYAITPSGAAVPATGNYETAITYLPGTLAVKAKDSGNGNGNGGNNIPGVVGWTVTPGKTPNMPTTASQTLADKPDASGKLTMIITKKMVESGIAEAKQGATGRELYGIALTFNNTQTDVKSLTATIEADALDYLVAQKVKSFTIQCGIMRITLDEKAIASLDSQSTGNVTITISPYKVSGAAQAAIGTRPVYDITFIDGTGKTVSDFGTGTLSIGIAYQTSKAGTGRLCAVYVKSNSEMEWLQNSSYDNGWLMFSRSSLSVYGVGYKPSTAFTDTATHWAKDNIDFAVSRGLFSGTSDTTFSPDTAITRGMFVTALGRLSGADVSGYTTSSFSDVKAGSYYLSYIEWAVKNGIVKGVGDNQFAPDKAITREEMAVIMQNYAKVAGYTLPVARQYTAFTDDTSISSWAKDAVIATQQAGIINGKDGGRYDPQGSATRAEAATILRRFVELVVDESTALGWVKNDVGQWQHYDWQGKRTTGWLTITGTDIKYYFDKNGIIVTGKWVEIGGKWYYFYVDGKLARNTTVEDYKVDGNGVRQGK